MRMTAVLFFAAMSVMAQTATPTPATLTLTGPTSVYPGQTANLTLTLAGSQGTAGGLQWSIAGPTGVTFAAPVPGAGSTAATKTPYCNAANTTCLTVGMTTATPPVLSDQPEADGVVATIAASIPTGTAPGSASIPLSGVAAADTTGNTVSISSGAAYSVLVLSPCDANADGRVDASDVTAVLSPIVNGGTCSYVKGCNIDNLIAVLNAANGGSCTIQ